MHKYMTRLMKIGRQAALIFVFFALLSCYAQNSWQLITIDKGGLCGEYPSAAITSTGDFVISTFANGNLKLLRSNNNSGSITWSSEVVDAQGIVGEFCSLALDHNDNPIIAYYDSIALDLKIARYDGSSWHREFVDSGYISSGRQASLDIGPDNNPAIAYIHVDPDGKTVVLRFARFDGTNWNYESFPAVKPSGGSNLSLKFAPDGNPAIAYSELSPQEVIYLKYNGTSWDASSIDQTISGGLYPSLCFDNNGLPGIAYYAVKSLGIWSMYDLRYSHFDGVEWSHVIVDIGIRSNDTGYFPSLKYDPDGHPCISYFEWGNATDLTFAHFTGSVWLVETPPQQGMVGFYSSLLFDFEGNANVFAFEIENNTLVWAKRSRY
jgi:hypothetical protein